MYINIITPCSRPQNLQTISESIYQSIPDGQYRWIVVFDADEVPEGIPDNCEAYAHRNPESIVGHAQRNYALELIDKGYVYSNDDDTVIHPELWDSISTHDADFISFSQAEKNGSMRLRGDRICVGGIDSHNFIVSYDIAKDVRFEIDKYEADGIYAEACYRNSNTKVFIDKILSVYNQLR
jgi:hypothetical protein